MALDTGAVTMPPENDPQVTEERTPTAVPTLEDEANIGLALRAIRLSRGLTIEQIVEATRVRTGHVEAIEALDLERLPSRPFAIGYVRAYARALGQNSEAAVDRFKREAPETEDAALPNPVGVRHAPKGARWGVAAAGGFLIIAAVIGWNVIRHISVPAPHADSQQVADAPLTPAPVTPATPNGPVSLGAPLPAPPEATTPDPYVTPGLPGQSPVTVVAPAASSIPMAPPPVGVAFVPNGPIYGAAQSRVILQARKPASLVIRGGGESILFASQLARGEAYRLPAGVSVDVVDPTAFQVFVDGRSTGMLPAPLTPASRLGL